MEVESIYDEDISLSIILPAFNEAGSIKDVVQQLRSQWPKAEILLVDDCSTDNTAELAQSAGARVIRHPYNMGNGASIKTGARNATGEFFVFMDADGQHSVSDIERLLEKLQSGFDLVVGARAADTQASNGRWLGNNLLNHFASLLTGRRIADLTSGFRATRARVFRQFVYLLPNGFSYPTTSTMAFLHAGYAVGFVPIRAQARQGKSKINFLRDGIRFLVIVMKITSLYSPMRVFFPLSLLFFILGLLRYLYFYLSSGGFSNMAGVLFVTSVLIFLIGLVSEQVNSLHYATAMVLGEEQPAGITGKNADSEKDKS
ncbi:MAG: glycosyltransferase family 2 protein [gamma proteobacterium symbiont of Bathyaustriella thionipta]|nr:glycosyltransferase family 2 protein [gamma proteobacterium symbiont of Bathyaustriella thionipta]